MSNRKLNNLTFQSIKFRVYKKALHLANRKRQRCNRCKVIDNTNLKNRQDCSMTKRCNSKPIYESTRLEKGQSVCHKEPCQSIMEKFQRKSSVGSSLIHRSLLESLMIRTSQMNNLILGAMSRNRISRREKDYLKQLRSLYLQKTI